jgi:hypothetical protein
VLGRAQLGVERVRKLVVPKQQGGVRETGGVLRECSGVARSRVKSVAGAESGLEGCWVAAARRKVGRCSRRTLCARLLVVVQPQLNHMSPQDALPQACCAAVQGWWLCSHIASCLPWWADSCCAPHAALFCC